MNDVQQQGIGEDQVLEALKLTKARLFEADIPDSDAVEHGDYTEDDWYFGSWKSCTCGHIYTVTGSLEEDQQKLRDAGHTLADRESVIINPGIVDGLYERVLKAILEAHRDEEQRASMSDATRVSDLTEDTWRYIMGPYDDVDQIAPEAAIALIDTTVDHIENRHREAMENTAG